MTTLQDPNELVPETQNIADVWATEGSSISHDTQARFKNLISTFKSTFNSLPTYVARSPGRVNIIGEHIDYSLYDVLPTALSVDVLVAIKCKPVTGTKNPTTTVKLANTNSRFEYREFDVPYDKEIEIDAASHDWSNYFNMDQAASIFSRRNYLLYTRFFPKFEVQHVPVPPSDLEFTFLVAQSFITSNKAETGPRHYNLRVAECTLATVVLARLNGLVLPQDTTSLKYSFRTFHQELMRKKGELEQPMEYQLDTIISLVQDQLTKEEGYTREEIAEILGIDVPALELQFLSSFPVEAERFKLRQRALHCFKEARRVLEFKACLTRRERLGVKDVEYLGQLLDQSQASCRDLYNCSCDEVNNICQIARGAGALGSRVTGAGWGGATVHMVPVAKIEAVKDALKKDYYAKRFPGITEEKLADAMIVSKPSNGSFLIYGKAITEA
ncbi:galactokinase [Ascosphaera apis ARSEF 7405]|uniref:Galactokinase n=1 Tax=Ascosphaera apis ARSEF 7405 TaxID=392613 RepID=A0A168B133_9EURO|nr:galactokinase [Ascosphaera apis ARSEF 7405]